MVYLIDRLSYLPGLKDLDNRLSSLFNVHRNLFFFCIVAAINIYMDFCSAFMEEKKEQNKKKKKNTETNRQTDRDIETQTDTETERDSDLFILIYF